MADTAAPAVPALGKAYTKPFLERFWPWLTSKPQKLYIFFIILSFLMILQSGLSVTVSSQYQEGESSQVQAAKHSSNTFSGIALGFALFFFIYSIVQIVIIKCSGKASLLPQCRFSPKRPDFAVPL